ncbi:MAG TPA: hypothetical protein VGK19_05555 [Capsulimonadaceae bacterium]|jgi:hypothetical protein
MVHLALRAVRAITGPLTALLALAYVAGCAQALSPGVGVEFGGSGSEPGKFADLRAFALDTKGNVYTVEGAAETKDLKAKFPGNLRIQKFDANGAPLAQFPLTAANGLPASVDPKRIAVDAAGYIYVTDNVGGVVYVFGEDGRLHKSIPVPHAIAIKRLPSGSVAVLPGDRAIVRGRNVLTPGTQLITLSPEAAGSSITLDKPVDLIQDFDVDKDGNIYVVGGTNQLFKYGATGKLLRTLGSGMKARLSDGSQYMFTVAVDSKGNVYTMDYSAVVKFDPDFKTVTLHQGKYSWFDDWNLGGSYFPLAVDASDHLWGATLPLVTHKLFDRFHYRPVVLRMADKFLVPGELGVTQLNTIGLGVVATLQETIPNNIAYDLKPIPLSLSIAASHKNTQSIAASYQVYDVTGTSIANGSIDVPLTGDAETTQAFTFTPPRYGWYLVAVNVSAGSTPIASVSRYYGVTKQYPGMTTLTAENKSTGWEDAARQTFAGLPLMRLHPAKGLDYFDKCLIDAKKYGASVFGQFSEVKDCTPENVRAVVTRFRGRVPVWEVMNEPNFKMPADKYVELLKQVAPVIKECDPDAKVMGPDVCGIQLPWYEVFYASGGGKLVDILSIHDYEGHETIDPEHWRWKIGALRAMMAKNGDAAKPLWQTERAITGVRGGNFLGAAQAVRVLMHRDLLETLGIPGEENSLYYMTQGGYSSVPSYIWSGAGPHPAVFGLRVRQAMIAGRKYTGTLDFGVQGNEIYQGLKYESQEGSTLTVRNLGALDSMVRFTVSGGDSVAIVDAFGNESSVPVVAGSCAVKVTQWPTYLRLEKGQTAVPEKINLGVNIAKSAKFSYSSTTTSDITVLNNGILEATHSGNPHGDTKNPPVFIGDLPTTPQTLTMDFATPQVVSSLIVEGLHADNAFCALLDYDIEAKVAGKWVPVQQVRTPLAKSVEVTTPQCTVASWLQDTNRFYNHFTPVTASALRLVVLRTSMGYAPDDIASGAVKKAWGKPLPAMFMLRELEAYAK